MAKVFISYKLPVIAQQRLEQAGHSVVVREEETLVSREELVTAVQEYEALLLLLTDKVDQPLLAQAGPQLKVIANYAVGFDNIDVAAAQARGIAVTNTPEVLTEAVAEHTVTLLAALARRIVESDSFLRMGKYHGWRPELLLGTGLDNKVLGIVGLGRIGVEVARRAQFGFGMKIAYNDLKPNADFEREFAATYYEHLDDLLPAVDAVSLHVPLLPATRHLINQERLALMKPTALLVNTARGPVVDEAALVAALQNQTIGGAALDVFEQEPELTPGLVELPNVVLTPHTASATIEARAAMAELAADNIIAVLAGKTALTPVKV
ncbi:MAG: D-glycerate dehydrogenase [Candidatus Andersenbacteria bacterium]